MDTLDLIIVPDEDDTEAAEILVDGSLEGHDYRFLLDTGAARTTVRYDSYTSAFATSGQRDSSGVFADDSYDVVTAPHLRLGPIVRSDFALDRVRENGPAGRNLIGMDLLKDYCLHFLFDESRLVIEPDDMPGATHLLDLFVDAKHHPYIPVQFGQESVSAVWDTGAGMTVVDTHYIQRRSQLFQEAGHSKGTDSTGTEMRTPMFSMAASIIGGYTFPPQKVAGVDLSRLNATLEKSMDLILGYNLIRQANWIFDFPVKKWGISKLLS
jgi:hypothetical protein